MKKHTKCKECKPDAPCALCEWTRRNVTKPRSMRKLKFYENVSSYGDRNKDLHQYFKYVNDKSLE